MKRLAASVIISLALALPAQAHKLKLFATRDGDSVTGYAFFAGGGRAQGADWVARDGTGAEIASGQTDAEGRYRFTPAQARDITVTVDTHEGHIATASLAAHASPSAPIARNAETAALVEAAVQHEIAPLYARIEEMDARMRVTDVVSGVFLIIGLAGMALYIRGRRG